MLFPHARGEMAGRLRAHDWGATPLGPVPGWPQSLQTVVGLMLDARQPAYIAWGPRLTSLYNDAYIPILGTKHPHALGQPYAELFAEVWPEYRPLIEATLAGEAQHFVDRPVALTGRPWLPLSWFTFSWTPLRDEAGQVAGFYCAATETTEAVLAREALRSTQEAALRHSEERYRTLADAVPALVWVCDGEGKTLTLNARWREFTGQDRQQQLGFGWTAAMHPEDAARLLPHWERCRREGCSYEGEVRYRRAADGAWRWHAFRALPLRQADGAVAAWYGCGIDIHDQKMAELALRESEERREAALAAARLGTFAWDLASGRVTLDARSRDIFGFAPEEGMQAEEVFARIHPEDRGRIRAGAETPEDGQSRLAGEFRIRRPDGGLRIIASLGNAVVSPDGRAERLVGVFADITERHQSERELRHTQAEAERQRRLYEAILTNTPDLAYVFDRDHRFIYANEGLLRMWGRRWEEAIGRTCLELGYPDWHAAMHDREIEQVIATRQPVRGQVPFTGTFGRRFYDYIFVPVLGVDGQVEAVAGTTRDITEQTETEAALRESEAQLATALSAARMAAWRWDPDADRVVFSATAGEVFGLLPGDRLESSAEGLNLLHPDDAEAHRALIREARERGTAWHAELRIIRPCDGRVAWLEERATAERDPATGKLRMTGLVWDISARKEAEERQRLLSREVDHRAKNALAVVQSALRLTRAPDLPAYVQAVTGRVAALARAQTLLAEDRWQGADLRTLLEGELAPFIGAEQRVVLDGPRIAVPAHAAQPLAMAVHELATNAVKYGALSRAGGRVTAAWRLGGEAANMLHLRWSEADGPPVIAPPARQGFGSRVLEGTVRNQLGGTVSLLWEPGGLVCDIVVRFSREQAGAAALAAPG